MVFVAELIPHEHIWAVFLTTFILGDLFGMALGLMEVTLAERLVTGAQGPGRRPTVGGRGASRTVDSKRPNHSSDRPHEPKQRRAPIGPAGPTQPDRTTDTIQTHPRRPTMEETIHGTVMQVLELSSNRASRSSPRSGSSAG